MVEPGDIERSLRRREKPRPVTQLKSEIIGVGYLYLEDIYFIYDQIRDYQQPMVDDHIHSVRTIADLVGGNVIKKERTAESLELLQMYNEEFEFDNVDQIGALKREGFTEITIIGERDAVLFQAEPGKVAIRVGDDSPEARELFANLCERVQKRRSIFRILVNTDLLVDKQLWILLPIYIVVIAISFTSLSENGWIGALLPTILVAMLFAVPVVATIFRSKFIVIPVHQSESRRRDWGLWVNVVLTIVTLLGVFATLLGVLLERRN